MAQTSRKPKRGLRGPAKPKPSLDYPDVSLLDVDELQAEVQALIAADEVSRRRWACDVPDCDGAPHAGWLHQHARASQRVPEWIWTTWMLMTGRGWGKTRTAAEAVREWAQKPNQFIAVVAKNETLVREICFESKKSGLLAVIPPDDVASYSRTSGNVHIVLKNGTVIRGFGGEVPDNLRGWAFDKAWCDEYAAWNRHTAQAVMDMLWFCLRESEVPQVIVSTTPKPLPHVVKLVKRNRTQLERLHEQAEAYANGEITDADVDQGPRVVITHGHTNENRANLSSVALDELEDSYDRTRLGDQELGGILLEDIEGSLWKPWMLEVDGFRVRPLDVPPLDRTVVAVDPAVTDTDTADETGFCVMGRGPWGGITERDHRPHGYVLHSEATKLTPIQTMVRAAELRRLYGAQEVVLEANNGGEYLATVLRMVDPTCPYRIVHAAKDKRARATPVAGLYEQERMHHVSEHQEETGAADVGPFDALEEVMTTFVGAPDKQEKSPDILDALVWAATDLFLDPLAPGAMGPGAKGKRADQRLAGRR